MHEAFGYAQVTCGLRVGSVFRFALSCYIYPCYIHMLYSRNRLLIDSSVLFIADTGKFLIAFFTRLEKCLFSYVVL